MGDHAVICRILGSHDKQDVQRIAQAFFRKYDSQLKALPY
jgi:hypothetical protein